MSYFFQLSFFFPLYFSLTQLTQFSPDRLPFSEKVLQKFQVLPDPSQGIEGARKSMESDKMAPKGMKVQIPAGSEIMSGGVEFPGAPNNAGQGGLTRQSSMTKTNCLCSPTTHAGSFRCRLHRTRSLQRTKSIESASLRDQASTVQAAMVDANKDQIH